MSQESWDDYFFKLVEVIKSKSKDRSTQVGCIVVSPSHAPLSTGYNGFPRGVNDDVDERHERPAKYKWMEHAERNAIYNAVREGIQLEGGVIYQSWIPCTDCARAIIQSGIKEVVLDGRGYEEKKAYWEERWKEDCDISKEMLREAGVAIRVAFRDDIEEI
jgi:dCMP deaminase